MTEKSNKLLEALSQFQADNITAKKTAKNPFFKSDYANLDEVIQAVNHGAKYGLSFSQSIDYEITEHGTIQFVRTNVYHKDCDSVLTSRCIISVKGNKFDDSHAVGSAITYAKRYSLCAIYGLATEDDDGNANAKKPTGSGATKYLDEKGVEQDIAEQEHKFPDDLKPKLMECIKTFDDLDENSTLDQIRVVLNDPMLQTVMQEIKKHKVQDLGNYKELLRLRQVWIDVYKKIKDNTNASKGI
tara:strand:- start:434 stop:1162 length:729 start_codon:yes stop_codon:yes gene_type:complete